MVLQGCSPTSTGTKLLRCPLPDYKRENFSGSSRLKLQRSPIVGRVKRLAPLPPGWEPVVSRSRPGEVSYRNTLTGFRTKVGAHQLSRERRQGMTETEPSGAAAKEIQGEAGGWSQTEGKTPTLTVATRGRWGGRRCGRTRTRS